MMDRLRRWWRMDGIPHLCQNCGRPMSESQNDAGLWVVCCPEMWVSFDDESIEHNYPRHTVRRISGRPDWGGCGHEHQRLSPLHGYPV